MNKIINCLASCMIAVSALAACATHEVCEKTMSDLNPSNFRTELNGKKTDLFVLKNLRGMEVCITNFGGRIVSIIVPDNQGNMRDVVLGFDSIQDYIKYPTDFGATIGRYANRINRGKITIDGTDYQLSQNNYGHCLHGGSKGFQYQVFDAKQLSDSQLELRYLSKDGEEGFPGNMACKVIFTLTEDNAIDIRYGANTDCTTVVNMTNHSYFNLNGDPSKLALNHLLFIDADAYTPIDDTFMTTGDIVAVEGTDMDFHTATAIGARAGNDFAQLKNGHGYDHNWVLNTKGDINRPCATLKSPATGIVLDVYTDEPGLQFYAGNFLDGKLSGKRGIIYKQHASVCLETQKYPDTPNKPEWPSALLYPGEIYRSHCIYKFSVEK